MITEFDGLKVHYDGRRFGKCSECGCITTKKLNELYAYIMPKLGKGLLCPSCCVYYAFIMVDGFAPQDLEVYIEERRLFNSKNK